MTRKWRQPWVSLSAKALSLILWLRGRRGRTGERDARWCTA